MSFVHVKALTMTIIFACFAFSSVVNAQKAKTATSQKMTKPNDMPAAPTTAEAAKDVVTQEVKYVMTSNPSEEKFEDMPLMKSRTLVAAETSIELKDVSHGLRKKAIFGLVPVRVYTAQFFAANPEKLVRTEDGFLASLKEAGPIQLRLTFLRDLPGQKIADSFKDGLEANKISTKTMSPELAKVMSEVTAIKQFSKETSYSITAVWKGNQASLLLEDPTEIKSITGNQEFADHFFAIWFGKPADGKLADLKKELIK
ncbi:MAG: hypothetical protein A2622_13910 [Bdellovibrionales bacterium RIFCSPHIGHO2_01_FULL_40_29]|nr:MAG: hypothetical protein A2622_13910 [Bdellovibrionales bacterium RIFCSPHIGHO2_01_FULL_40_29]OFZ35585.1 MAG: hypothetical protein A3D17_11420 [Bdellovibrionales bacterium RIFCSPHIGHO2_02_FULL_40_15]